LRTWRNILGYGVFGWRLMDWGRSKTWRSWSTSGERST